MTNSWMAVDSGAKRRIYFREMVARFGAFVAPTWNLGEETKLATDVLAETAAYISSLDPYRHPVTMHSYPAEKERYRPMLGTASTLTGMSMQSLYGSFDDVRGDIVKWSTAAREKGRPMIIGYDELGGPFYGAPFVIDICRHCARRGSSRYDARFFCAFDPIVLIIGRKQSGMPSRLEQRVSRSIMVFFGGCGDLDCQDHRSRSEVWEDGARAVGFFEKYIGEAALDDASR